MLPSSLVMNVLQREGERVPTYGRVLWRGRGWGGETNDRYASKVRAISAQRKDKHMLVRRAHLLFHPR